MPSFGRFFIDVVLHKKLGFYVLPWGDFDGFTKITRMPGNPAKKQQFHKNAKLSKKGWTKTKVYDILFI